MFYIIKVQIGYRKILVVLHINDIDIVDKSQKTRTIFLIQHPRTLLK